MDSSLARGIAERLAAASDERLAELFTAQGIRPDAPPASSWRDFFDAAEHLLQPEQIAAAVAALPRDEVAALLAGRAEGSLVLAHGDGTPIPPVSAALAGVDVAPASAVAASPASDADAGHAAERALTTITALADIVIGAAAAPLSRVGSGSVGAADRRRLVDERVARTPAEVDALIDLATTTGLLRAEGRRFATTPRGAAWTELSTPDRWAHLAELLRDAMPAGLRTPAGGWIPPEAWQGAYPLDEAWQAQAARWRLLAHLLGLVSDRVPPTEPAWSAPLRRGDPADPAPLAAHLPHEVDQVFLQNDLTAISPGPLAPALDVRLRRMAVRESQAQAATYRFTEASVSRAFAAGETADEILGFLTRLSLTGVPQPLRYLVERTAERHGLVRVSLDVATGHTVVSSPDHDLVRTIAVDQSLAALGLVADAALLRTRAPRDTVFWALADARYPAVAIDDGVPIALDRHRLAGPESPPASYDALIARLREGQGPDAEAAWLDRELQQAVRDRARIVVSVEMPGGDIRELSLEATGLGGGRLRGRDQGADVERTLPVSLIRAMRRLPAS